MLIDVLLPFHLNNLFLENAIESLANSRGVSIRLILVDDRLDKSEKLPKSIKNFGSLEIVSTKGQEGYGHSLKRGSELIQSEFVALMNSDDLVDPNRFLKQLEMLENSEISITNIQRMDANGKLSASLSGEIRGQFYDPLFLLLGSYGANATWCMHRDWWKKFAYFDADECLDWRIALKSFNHSKISYSREKLYIYRRHNLQVTAEKTIKFERMLPTFDLWSRLLVDLCLPSQNYSVFNLIGTPWNSSQAEITEDFFEFMSVLKSRIDNLPKESQEDFLRILKRRCLFSIQSSSSVSTSMRLLHGSKGEILPLFRDLLI